MVGLDHELMTNFGIGVMYFHRKYDNFCGSASQQCVGSAVRYLDSTSEYLSGGPQTFTAPCGNSLCSQASYTGVYYNISAAQHSNTIQENIGEYRVYDGLELTARKRMSHRWMMTTSYVYNRELNYMPLANIDYLDPTNHSPVDFVNGYEDGTRNSPHVFKLSGLYQFPFDINASANFNAHSNFPFNPDIVTGTRPNGIGTATIVLAPANSLRLPAVRTLDLNFDKAVRLGGARRITLNMAIFNVTNSNTTLGLANTSSTAAPGISNAVRQNTSTADFVTTIVGPRVIRFGARINF
jgi:hypothetical protein